MAWSFDENSLKWYASEYSDLNMTTANNLLAYGQPWQPNDAGKFNNVIYSSYKNTGNVTVEMPQNQVMTYGYGSGVTLNDFGISNYLGKDVNLANGYYTKQDLIDEGIATSSDFAVGSQLYIPVFDIADGNIFEAYVHGTVRFGIGNDSRFVVVDGKLVEIEADLRAYDDNFDFESSTIPDWLNGAVLSAVGPDGELPQGAKVFISYRGEGRSVVIHAEEFCFLAGTPILLAGGSEKPIEEIDVGDEVQSYNAAGELVTSRVSKVFRNQSKHILDVFGLMVTPGHVTFCGDGEFAGQHAPIIDILRSDGALMKSDGTLVRAATGCLVGSEGDALLWAVTGECQEDGTVAIKEKAQIRAGSRFILDDGRDICVLDVIKAAGGELTADGYIKLSGSDTLLPFHWLFTESLPAPEDYVLQRSQVSLKEIYEAGEWEGRSSNFSSQGLGATRKIVTRSATQIASGEPNIPLGLQDKLH